jgi:hypothetical protein
MRLIDQALTPKYTNYGSEIILVSFIVRYETDLWSKNMFPGPWVIKAILQGPNRSRTISS